MTNRPGANTRPGLVETLPAIANPRPPKRPGLGQMQRPGAISTLPAVADRPPNRPQRPVVVTRPIRPGRPNGNRGDNFNNLIVNNPTVNNIHNHQQLVNNYNGNSGWWGGGRPGHAHWGDHWYDQHVHVHHQGWYHGCWGGHWASAWVAPFAFGSLGWGNSNFLYSSGYVQYVNPYPTTVIIEGIDYSRPIIIQRVVQPTQIVVGAGKIASAAPEAVELEPGLAELDAARGRFHAGDFQQARILTERALQQRPGDPAAHEFYALCLFALGEYRSAAAVLNALLASSPGWDWTTMSSLYDSPATYERQLRGLENVVRSDPDDVAGQFVLGYHYLVCGHGESALKAMNRVWQLEPRDKVAGKLVRTLEEARLVEPEQDRPEEERLAELEPARETGTSPRLSTPEQNANPTPDPPVDPRDPRDPADAEEDQGEVFDLVGVWRSELPQGGQVTLTIREESTFRWKVEPATGAAKEISGTLTAANDLLVLETPEDGTMIGRAQVKGEAEFAFILQGAAEDDPGLSFRKLAEAE